MRGRPPKLHLSHSMRVWVDADGCPKSIREILFSAADRCRTVVTLVSAQPLSWPNSAFIRSLVVQPGFEPAAQKIEQMVAEGDIVVTADMALVTAAAGKKATTLTPRGERHTRDSLKLPGSARPNGKADGHDAVQFADQLDQLLAKKPAAIAS